MCFSEHCFFSIYLDVRPVRKEERKKYLEEKLAKEQTEKEQELLMKQEQPEMLKS